MSLDGTVNKTGILLALCVGGAFFGWNAPGLALPAVIIGFVIALFTIFRPKNSPYTAPAYAAIEGVALGCLLYTSPSPRDKRQSRMPSSA